MFTEEFGTTSYMKSRDIVFQWELAHPYGSHILHTELFQRAAFLLWSNCREGGKEKKVNVDLEPFKPVSTSLCVTGSTEALVAQLSVTAVWFRVIGGSDSVLCHP